LGCSAELENALEIPSRGTSAHLQIDTYERACQEGKAPAEALRDVVDMLIEETVKNL
jgi:carboxylate-amine ligase